MVTFFFFIGGHDQVIKVMVKVIWVGKNMLKTKYGTSRDITCKYKTLILAKKSRAIAYYNASHS